MYLYIQLFIQFCVYISMPVYTYTCIHINEQQYDGGYSLVLSSFFSFAFSFLITKNKTNFDVKF